MGLLANIDRHIRNETVSQDGTWLSDWFRGGSNTDAGASVNSRSAMGMAVVWQCVSWRAKMYGHLPHKLYEGVEILGRSAQREARPHPLFPLIHTSPNPTLTSAAWHGLISADLHLDGNSYAWKERGSTTGRIRHLWRFMPDMIRLDQEGNGPIDYYARRSDGTEQHFSADEILHIRGLGYDGVRGYNPIHLLREELGWTLATRKFSSKFYKNAFRPSGLILSPNTLKEPAKTSMLNALRESGKDGGLGLLEGAFDYKPLMIPQNDQQFLETMQLQDDRVAGIMEVYPQEIGIMRSMTNNNVEQMTISSITRNLAPFAVNVEQWMNLQLLSDAPSSGRGGGTERERFFVQSNFHALLRGDTAAQTAHLIAMRDRGIYDGNDCADYLGLPPFVGGDLRTVNGAMVPLEDLKEIAAKRGAPPTEPPEKPGAPEKNALAMRMFRDAVGRIASRKPQDRKNIVAQVFTPIIAGLAEDMTASIDSEFMGFYVGALAMRVADWDDAKADAITAAELDRLIAALKERQS